MLVTYDNLTMDWDENDFILSRNVSAFVAGIHEYDGVAVFFRDDIAFLVLDEGTRTRPISATEFKNDLKEASDANMLELDPSKLWGEERILYVYNADEEDEVSGGILERFEVSTDAYAEDIESRVNDISTFFGEDGDE